MSSSKKAGPEAPAGAPKATPGDVALVSREYFRLPAAAQLLGLQADDLVHMAKQGALRLCVLGGGRSFRVVDIIERHRVTGRTDGGPAISVERDAAMRDEAAAVWGPIKVPALFVEELEATGATSPGHFDDCDQPSRMLFPVVPFAVHSSDLVVRAGELAAMRGQHSKGSTYATTGERFDAMSMEIEHVLTEIADSTPVTAGSLMPLLRSRAGQSGSCITDIAKDGVLWRRASGAKVKLSTKDLKDRLGRRMPR